MLQCDGEQSRPIQAGQPGIKSPTPSSKSSSFLGLLDAPLCRHPEEEEEGGEEEEEEEEEEGRRWRRW